MQHNWLFGVDVSLGVKCEVRQNSWDTVTRLCRRAEFCFKSQRKEYIVQCIWGNWNTKLCGWLVVDCRTRAAGGNKWDFMAVCMAAPWQIQSAVTHYGIASIWLRRACNYPDGTVHISDDPRDYWLRLISVIRIFGSHKRRSRTINIVSFIISFLRIIYLFRK